jgi:hypothetical protein
MTFSLTPLVPLTMISPTSKEKKNLKFCQEMNRMCFSLLNPNSFANDISFVSLEELKKSMTTCMNNFVVILDIV